MAPELESRTVYKRYGNRRRGSGRGYEDEEKLWICKAG